MSGLARARAAAVALGSIILVACASRLETVEIGVGSRTFTVEVARSAEERATGLMRRARLEPTAGMIFVFESDQQLDFWMKDTLTPLSIAFLSSAGKITEIRDMRALSLDVIKSRFACRYALELNLGAFAQAGAVEGDFVRFPPGFK